MYEFLLKHEEVMETFIQLHKFLVEYFKTHLKTEEKYNNIVAIIHNREKLKLLEVVTPEKSTNNFTTSILFTVFNQFYTLNDILEADVEETISKITDFTQYISNILKMKDSNYNLIKNYILDDMNFININEDFYKDEEFINLLKDLNGKSSVELLKELEHISEIEDAKMILRKVKELSENIVEVSQNPIEIGIRSFSKTFIVYHSLLNKMNDGEMNNLIEYYYFHNFLNGVDSLAKAFIVFEENGESEKTLFKALKCFYVKVMDETSGKVGKSSTSVYKRRNSLTAQDFIRLYNKNMPMEWTVELFFEDYVKDKVVVEDNELEKTS